MTEDQKRAMSKTEAGNDLAVAKRTKPEECKIC